MQLHLRMGTMSSVDPDIKSWQDEKFRSKVRRARQMTIAERVAAGPNLFDENIRMMRCMIESSNPGFGAEQVEAEIARRLKISRQLSDRGIYCDADEIDE